MSVTRNPLSGLTPQQRELLLRRVGRGSKQPKPVVPAIPPIVPVSREHDLPLSYSQQRMWFVDQLTPGNGFYNVPLSLHLGGKLNCEVLERSLAAVIDRHEALRTRFLSIDGKPVQQVCSDYDWRLEELDCIGLDEKEALAMLTERSQRPWDLRQAPLMRATLLKLRENEHVLLLVMHHIVMDGWSCGLLIKDLMALYEAFLLDRPSPLPELKVQYGDFAYWQRNWLQGAALEAELAYWKEQLYGAPNMLDLPLDRPRPSQPRHRGSRVTSSITGGVIPNIKELARQEGATTFMVLLAAFQLLLARHSGQQDICVGTPIANRTRKELEEIVGILINMLVLRTDLSGAATFRELLGRVREVCLGAYAHQDMPFETLVESLGPERSLQHNPLFQVIFVAQHAPFEPVYMGEVELNFFPFDKGVTRYDLECHFLEGERQINLRILYNSDIFDHSSAERLLRHFRNLLEVVLAAPDSPLSEIDILDPEERRQILTQWNRTSVDYPGTSLVHRLIEAQAAQTPAAIAAVCGAENLTYAEVNRRANQLARYLRGLGVDRETPVGLHLETGVDALLAVLGVLKSGGVYLPLDPLSPPDRLASIIGDVKAPVVLCRTLDSVKVESPGVKYVPLDDLWPKLADQDPADLPEIADPENLAYIIFTSGSTGRPKGVCITHRGLNNYFRWAASAYPVTQGSGSLVHSPLSFDLTLTGIFPVLMTGGTIKLTPEPGNIDQLASLLQDGTRYSLIKLTPSHLKILGELCHQSAPEATASLIIGGEALNYEDLLTWQRRSSQLRCFNEYGPTETVVGCCVHEVRTMAAVCGPVPIGRPIANTRLYVCDERLQPVPLGTPGQLCVAGAGLGRGYFAQPQLTAERWRPDPFGGTGERLYLTGDLVRQLTDGQFQFIRRLDNQIKIRGFRVELGEIESVIKQHAAALDAAVLALEDSPGHKYLVGYVVPVENASADPAEFFAEIRGYLQSKFPAYMIPTAFALVPALPLTPNGKLDSRALPALSYCHRDTKPFEMPESEAERIIARLWQDLLQIGEVGVNDNFFDLGGNSLLAVQLRSQLNRNFGLELPVADIFQFPTVAAMASHLGTHKPSMQELAVDNLPTRAAKKRAVIETWKTRH